MKLFLDACIITYLIEAKEPFFSAVQHTLRTICEDKRNIPVAISRLSIFECLVEPVRRHDHALVKQYRSFFSRQDLKIVEIDAAVMERALHLRTSYHLRTPDALQAASALESAPAGSVVFIGGNRSFAHVSELNSRII